MNQIKKASTLGTLLGALAIITQTHTAMWQGPHNIKIAMKRGSGATIVAPHAQFDMDFKAFDNTKKQVNLNALVFGTPNIHIGNIFLASNLAANNKVGIQTGGDYLSLLSTMTVDMSLDEKHFSCALEGSISGSPFDTDSILTLDVMIPFEYYEHNIDVEYISQGIAGTAYGSLANTPGQFF